VSTGADYTVVIPTLGRPSLAALLGALADGSGPAPVEVLVVDDRPEPAAALAVDPRVTEELRVRVLPGAAAGPAAARNRGWRAAGTTWVAFLDDDVLPPADWRKRLVADLAELAPAVAGSQGRVVVPQPTDRRPTDWERSTAGLETARWITADMAYRREALEAVGGFDERFPRAYREDADLALRVLATGRALVRGQREVTHPVRPAGPWVSVRVQAGNADDPLMRRLHGRGWRRLVGAPRGRRPRHLLTTAAGLGTLTLALSGRRRSAGAVAVLWVAGTAEVALARIAAGPRTAGEVTRMLATSAVLPPAATYHWLRGVWRHRAAGPWQPAPPSVPGSVAVTVAGSAAGTVPAEPAAAVLFDRDGTLVEDIPYNGDPDRVLPVPGAREALDRLRGAGLRLGVVSNQSGIARGLLTATQVAAVNARVERLLGPFDVWQVCPHDPDGGCECRKPRPGMVVRAASTLGVPAERCVVIGDIGSDVEAATAAGARAVLVPTSATRSEEIRSAPVVAPDLGRAVDLVLGGLA